MRRESGEGYTPLGAVLYELRVEEGLNIQQQSEKFGVKYSFINAINKGTRKFSPKTIRHIVELYKERPDVQKKIAYAWIPGGDRILEMGGDLRVYFYANTGLLLNE